jgi:hypothetical protein
MTACFERPSLRHRAGPSGTIQLQVFDWHNHVISILRPEAKLFGLRCLMIIGTEGSLRNPIFYARLYYLMKVEVPSVSLLTISSFGLNVSIVLVVDLFKTRSSSALVMLNVIDLPLIAQVPPIVPVTTPWPSVLLEAHRSHVGHKTSVGTE